MWTYEALVSFSFRWIDLLIISSLGGFAFWRWVLPLFKQEIAQEQQQWQDLEDQITQHKHKASTLKKSLVHDKHTSDRLKKQIHMWRIDHEKKQQKRLQEKKDVTIRLHEWYHERAVGIERDAVYKQVVPKAIDQAQEDLKKAFQDEKVAQAFNATIIEKLKEGSA